MVGHIRQAFPDRINDASDTLIVNFVRECSKKAERFGIEYEEDIRRFIEYSILYGVQFDTNTQTEWLGNILRQSDLDGTTRMNMIDEMDLQLARRDHG